MSYRVLDPPALDPTGGEGARAAAEGRDVLTELTDPTDPRWGTVAA